MQTAVLLSYKSTYIGIQMGLIALGVPFQLMEVLLLGYRLDYPRLDSWQEPDIILFSKMPT